MYSDIYSLDKTISKTSYSNYVQSNTGLVAGYYVERLKIQNLIKWSDL